MGLGCIILCFTSDQIARLRPLLVNVYKIVIIILGGLGNQLLAYATARRLALIKKAEIAIGHINGFRYDSQYQRYYQLAH